MNLDIETARVFEPLLAPSRYKAAYGGRASGKSHFFAELCIEEAVAWPSVAGCGLCLLSIREHQKSLRHSAKSLIEKKLWKHRLGPADGFNVYREVIETPGDGIIVFQGMKDHTADSVKSFEGFHRAWVEEAQTISNRSIDLLDPTIRWEDKSRGLASELWYSWNPRRETDPVDVFFRGEDPPEELLIVEANYHDNPFFPEVLQKSVERDKRRDFDKYLHKWLGQYEILSSAIVFKNWEVKEFNTPADAVFRFGLDFGFSNDPAVFVRCYIIDDKLFVDQEAYGKKVRIEKLPGMMGDIKGAELWPIIADSSRPETIDYLRRHSYPRILPSIKGTGSIEDGIEFLQSFDIIVHPRCKETIYELKNYRYKIDKDRLDREGKPMVLPVLEDKNNHVIDALRYACEATRRGDRIKKSRQVRMF